MSSYLAVGGVSAVLRAMLASALSSDGPSTVLAPTPGITVSSPDLITTGADEQPQLNLFMYYVSLNPALRNLDLPSRNRQGENISNPPLALNLHYLVSAYGGKPLDPEILLGWAMKVFHDTPVVSAETIREALEALLGQPSAEAQLVGTSKLAQQIEHLRITPEALTTEEIYRLWTAFQAPYRPSTALQVSVVVIQDSDSFPANPPVQTRVVAVQPLQEPVIETISPAIVAAGEVLTITGSNLLGDASTSTLVSFDSAAGIAPESVQSNFLQVALPATLQAGTRTVRVQRTILYEDSSVPHAGFSSSAAVFQLAPSIQEAFPVSATHGAPLTLSIAPDVGREQEATLYIGDVAIPIEERPVNGPASASTLTFALPATLPTGTFALRVEIDGAQSRLTALAGGSAPQIEVSA